MSEDGRLWIVDWQIVNHQFEVFRSPLSVFHFPKLEETNAKYNNEANDFTH